MPSDIICIALQFFQYACRNGGCRTPYRRIIAVFQTSLITVNPDVLILPPDLAEVREES